MNAVIDTSIVSLRLHHCRAERAMNHAQYHLAALHYRYCLEAAEQRYDCRAVQFFALRLADCYAHMRLPHKAQAFQRLAHCCPTHQRRRADQPNQTNQPSSPFPPPTDYTDYGDENDAATC